MENSNPILVMESIDDINSLKIEYISNETIPEILNGESGFHVYHVRMLTELILKQLKKISEDFSMSDEEISAISVASSLHDIGKSRIPKSILDYPGKLSPLEYDIVKKHSIFGEELIDMTNTDIDPKIISHAKDIARSHHERYDGTGYPDAKKGDAIPLSAQVVSLADAFDALTTARSYKEAFSQDVAIEMISNGMCGVFNPQLTECLLQVVNNAVLVEIREKIKKTRAVIAEDNSFVSKKVLFVGNTGYITQDFINLTFPESKITVIGDTSLKTTAKNKVIKVENPPYDAIFETYSFDMIIYLSKELTYISDQKSDGEELKKILKCASETQKDVKFLYFSSLDGAFEENSDTAYLTRSKESMCEYYSKEYYMDIKIVRIPYLFSGTYKNDYLYSIFEQAEKGKVKLSDLSSSRCYFLSTYDLAELIVRFADNWTSGNGILNINDEFNIKFADFAHKLCSLKGNVKIEFTGEKSQKNLRTNNRALRNEYGWFSKISVLEDMEEQYELYLTSKKVKNETIWDKIKNHMAKYSPVVKILELFVLFAVTELLIHLTDSAIFFSIVDFRMAYIVIMGTVHGLGFGIAAAGLSSLSWLVAKIMSGTKWITIFYEPTNWLSFVFFFLVGALCGYIKLKSDDKIKSLDSQNELLEEKLVFTRELYTDTFNERRDLKKQIIGSKDSFGKIFDVTRNLDTVEPRKLYLKIMDTFEDILENKSISVYSVNDNSAFGRLEVASRDIITDAARSVSLEAYKPILDRLSTKEIWKNSELIPNLPMYAAGVYRGDKLELLIFIWHSAPNQRSLYYVNLFKILRDLVQMSLLRAFDYNQAIYEKQYIPDTHILNTEAFVKTYENFKRMAERKVFSYILMEIDTREYSYEEVDQMLTKRIRTNDILGIDEKGELKLLLSQATENDLEFILPRFESLDIGITVLKK